MCYAKTDKPREKGRAITVKKSPAANRFLHSQFSTGLYAKNPSCSEISTFLSGLAPDGSSIWWSGESVKVSRDDANVNDVDDSVVVDVRVGIPTTTFTRWGKAVIVEEYGDVCYCYRTILINISEGNYVDFV